MPGHSSQFSLDGYAHLLDAVSENGYRIMRLCDYRIECPGARVLILRHDVDMNPVWAKTLAEIELARGVRSTFFVRLRAQYNVFQIENQAALHWLRDSGFEIGLHNDTVSGGSTREEFVAEIALEKRLLEEAVGDSVRGICPHMPKRQKFRLTPNEIVTCGFLYDAGEHIFNKHAKFASDSSGMWKNDLNPVNLLGVEQQIYLLTHPVWWVTNLHPQDVLPQLQAWK